MKPETTNDVPLTEAEAQYGKPQDRIVKLLQLGFSRDEVFHDICEKCSLSIRTKKHKKELANLIAQIDDMNVFSTGTIPEGA
ncbi:MAG: hypothetical protein EBY48_10585 [Opitutae bacterium]|nr:hypothetical protein [Opitutae bacterium]